MNTIPSIFNERQIDRTVLGGNELPEKVLVPVTCVILNRYGNKYRNYIFDNIVKLGFQSIICISSGTSEADNNIFDFSRQYPFIKFIMTLENVTPGDMLNIAMGEAKTDYVLVVQDDLCVENLQFPPLLVKKMISLNHFCVCPKLFTSKISTLQVKHSPSVKKSVFKVESSASLTENVNTLYASDLAGFYNREKYIQLGGADYTIETPYWQKLDLFFRSWLWGEFTCVEPGFVFTYAGELPQENQTVDYSYLRFYLKNLLPVYRKDHAEIPLTSFFAFNSRSSVGMSEKISIFRDAQKWTYKNRYRFKKDAVSLIENWS